MNKAEKTRQYIIERAAPIINRKGMAGTSITDIMEATKLAKGGIYGNFESKDEICAEAFNFLVDKLSSSIDARLATKKTYRAKLFELLDLHAGLVSKETSAGCPMLNFGSEADDTDPLVRQQVNKSIIACQSRISKLIKSGIDAGEFDKKLDPALFSVKAFAMMEGAIFISKIQNNTRQMRMIIDALKQEIEEHTK